MPRAVGGWTGGPACALVWLAWEQMLWEETAIGSDVMMSLQDDYTFLGNWLR